MGNRTEPAEPNRTEPLNSGTGRNRTRKRTEPNRTEPWHVRKMQAEPHRNRKHIFPNWTEPNRLLLEKSRTETNRTELVPSRVECRTVSFKRGEGAVDWDTAVSNCSTGTCCLISTRGTTQTYQIEHFELDEGFQPYHPSPLPKFGWHYSSNATSLIWLNLLYVFSVVSRITKSGYIIRHFRRTPVLDKSC